MSPANSGAWMSIAEQITKETNPHKISSLVHELCLALERKPQLQQEPDSPPLPQDLK